MLFHGISESKDENALVVLQKFLTDEMKLTNGKDLLIQRVHRLGRPRSATTIGSKSTKPRPIIASFVDYRQREHVRQGRYKLNSRFSVTEDLPIEIRKAREQLIPELKEMKNRNKRAAIVYPAKLLVEGKIVREINPSDFVDRSSRV